MEKSLECSICFNDFIQPKLLPCLHTFCLKCLTRYCEEESDGDRKPCPICRTEFCIPQRGVERLEDDEIVVRLLTEKRLRLGQWAGEDHCEICEILELKTDAKHFCVECRQRFCGRCRLFHLRQKVSESHKFINVEERPSDAELMGLDKEFCTQHKNKEIDFFCCDCKELFCYICQTTKHRNHVCETPADIVKSKERLFSKSRDDLVKCLTESKSKIDDLKLSESEFLNQLRECVISVEGSCTGSVQSVNEYRDQLIKRFDEIRSERIKEIESERDRYQRRYTELDSFITYSRIVMERGTDCEIIRVADRLEKRAEELIKSQDEYNKKVLNERSVRLVAPAAAADVRDQQVRDLVGSIQYKGEWAEKRFEVTGDILQAQHGASAQVIESVLLSLMKPLSFCDSTETRNKIEIFLQELHNSNKIKKKGNMLHVGQTGQTGQTGHREEKIIEYINLTLQEITEKLEKQRDSVSEYQRTLNVLSVYEIRNNDLTLKLDREIIEKKQIESENNKLKSDIEKMKKESEKQNKQIIELTGKLNQVNSEKKLEELKLNNHISELDRTRMNSDLQTKQINELTAKLKEVKDENELEISNFCREIDKMGKDFGKDLNDLTLQLRQVESEKFVKESELIKLKTEKQKLVSDHNKTITSTQNKLSEAVRAREQAVVNFERERKIKQDTEAKLSEVRGQKVKAIEDLTSFKSLSGTLRILVLVGLNRHSFVEQKICHINLERENTINIINSTPTSICVEPAACVINNKLYTVGVGSAYNELWRWSATVEFVDHWTRLADLPSGRRRHCATSVGEKMYVLGGWVDADKRALDSVLCYDINSNSWTLVTRFSIPVQGAACVTYKSLVCVFGGLDTRSNSVNHFQAYDTITGEYVLSTNPMPAAQSLMRAVMWKSKALLIGKFTCYIYDFERKTWEQRNRFKTGFVHFGLTLNDDILYISGGGICQTDENHKEIWTASDEVKRLSVYDFVSDNKQAQWKHHATLPYPVLIHSFNSQPLYI